MPPFYQDAILTFPSGTDAASTPAIVDNATFTVNIGHLCEHCGNWHNGICPRISSIEYYPDGQIERINFRNSFWPYRK